MCPRRRTWEAIGCPALPRVCKGKVLCWAGELGDQVVGEFFRGSGVELFVAVTGDQCESTLQVGSHGGENHSCGGAKPGLVVKVGGSGTRPRFDSIAVSTNRSPVRCISLGTARLTASGAFPVTSRRS